MDDLEVNPLHKALLTRFRREFEIASRMCYLLAIPHSSSLEDRDIDQHFANSHILMPSKLLKMHFNQLQAGDFDHIELDGRRLVCRPAERAGAPLVVRVLAEEVGYNANSKELRTLLIERPLLAPTTAASSSAAATAAGAAVRAPVSLGALLAPLSPRLQQLAQRAKRQRAQLISARKLAHHDDCARYLECVSQPLTGAMEEEVRRMQANYVMLARYLEDVATRARSLAERYVRKFERAVELSQAEAAGRNHWPADTIARAIRLSVENHVVHLLHGKLMAGVQRCYARHDAALQRQFAALRRAAATPCQLGAQRAFAHFALADELLRALKRLPNLQSPIAMASGLLQLVELLSAALNQSAELRRLLGEAEAEAGADVAPAPPTPTAVCSDDLIAALVFSLARAAPNNLFSALRYLELFGWSAVERDQAAYYLATLESAVAFIMNFGAESARAQPQQIGRDDFGGADCVDGRDAATTAPAAAAATSTSSRLRAELGGR